MSNADVRENVSLRTIETERARTRAKRNGNGDVSVNGAAIPMPFRARLVARTAKRGVDIVGSLLALILLSPLWLLIAVMIKIDSHGPVLFRHRRVGRNAVPFEMRKFRTMVKDADHHKLSLLHLNEAGDGLFKIERDPRVTRFGRFLRSTSLDELPQLLHVLTGKMSLVGPRPLVPEEDERIEGAQRSRLTMRPGMTGVWQVAGASRIPLSEMAVLDAEYVENWSPWGDLKLLFGTVPHVVRRRGI